MEASAQPAGRGPADADTGDDEASLRLRPPTTLVVLPRSAEVQGAEDVLELALVALVGGTRPQVTTAMVYSYLFNRFEITSDVVDVRRHYPEDFVVRFLQRADRDRVLGSQPGGYLIPLIWRPWRRTSLASMGEFRFRVFVALARVPLHARNGATAQAVLGTCCSSVEPTKMRDTPKDDDREYFVKAWCWHPNLIEDRKMIFIPEPEVAGIPAEERTRALGLRYLITVRLIAYQDWTTPPGSLGDGGNGGPGDDAGPDQQSDDGRDDYWPTPRWDSDVDDSGDSSNYNYHPTGYYPPGACLGRVRASTSVRVGAVSCPLQNPSTSSFGNSSLRWEKACSTPAFMNTSVVQFDERWQLLSAPRTPRVRSCVFEAVTKAGQTHGDQWVSPSLLARKKVAVESDGLVGRFLAVDPQLLHGGQCYQSPPLVLHADWWSECAENELAFHPPLRSSGGAMSGSMNDTV